ncbi:hypothetical protein WIS52_31550 [Pseudonocardia nematodicida]|uniref:DUF4439 domain-containing protein n=1 Tax=Pseudonocardia nematodicida TaxID=1206997 RepID=A0ABV1KKP2_9PSEU
MRGSAGFALSRRRALAAGAAAVVLPPLLGACTAATDQPGAVDDALLAMSDAARMDAAMVVAAVTADPGLAERLEPLRAARIEHARALDSAGGRAPEEVVPPATPPAADVVAIRDAVAASARTATEVAGNAPALQIGLVAEIAACCATYATVLA